MLPAALYARLPAPSLVTSEAQLKAADKTQASSPLLHCCTHPRRREQSPAPPAPRPRPPQSFYFFFDQRLKDKMDRQGGKAFGQLKDKQKKELETENEVCWQVVWLE